MLGLAWPNIYNDDDGLVGLVAMSILDQSTYTTQIDRQVWQLENGHNSLNTNSFWYMVDITHATRVDPYS